MKIECAVTSDLLPLYLEEIVSEESRKQIEEHLQTCTVCQKEFVELKMTDDFPIDTNTDGLQKIKAKLFKDKFKAVLFAIMITTIIVITGTHYLTKPLFLPYNDSLIEVIEKDNGEIFVHFDEQVTGYDVDTYLLEDGIYSVYELTAWKTFGDKFLNHKKNETLILNPDGNKIASIHYSSAGALENTVIYGKNTTNDTGSITLPRLFLTQYVRIAGLLLGLLLLITLATYKFKKIQTVIRHILLVPISFIVGTLIINGFQMSSYTATRDFFIILLIIVPIYGVLLLGFDFYKQLKEK